MHLWYNDSICNRCTFFGTIVDKQPLEIEQIQASSYRVDGNQSRLPEYGILHHNNFWAPIIDRVTDRHNQKHWFQVKLSALAGITGIRTQGAGIQEQWVKQLYVYAGNDESYLMPIREAGRAKVQFMTAVFL